MDDLKSVDASVLLGLIAGYDFLATPQHDLVIEAEARQDVAGDNGFLGTLRLRYGSPLSERWRLDASVGTSWASEDYMSSYFGIDAGDAARSGLGQYNADESFKDVTRRSLAELSLPRKLERDGDWLVYPPDRRRRRQPGGRRRRRRQQFFGGA